MFQNIQIKKFYYSPVKSFNFIEDNKLNILKSKGIENDRIFAFVRNKTKQEAIKFQNKQYLRNNQSYLSVKNTPLLNSYQVTFKDNQLKIYKECKELIVIKDFDFFAVEKWKIASDRRGSGNTANIGSINDIGDLKSGNGVFCKLGEEWFDEYWINYGTATMVKEGKTIKVSSIWDFLEFKGRKDLFDQVVAKGAKRKRPDQK